MRYFSTFSGIGGFEIGIQRAFDKQLATIEQDRQGRNRNADKMERDVLPTSWTTPLCVGYSEIDKYAIKVYERQFNGDTRPDLRNGAETIQNNSTNTKKRKDGTTRGHKNYGDITKINAEELPDFDCLIGGFPCQAFSIAGKRKGFDDTRGTLFFDLARILRAKQPRLFVFENVKGLLSHDNGQTFATIISTLTELGYDCQWQVLNSKNHGVPQNRERVIIVGHSRGTPRPQVFPITETDRTIDEGHEPQNTPGEVASTVRSRYGNGTGSHIRTVGNVNPSGNGMNGNVISSDGLCSTLSTNKGEGLKIHQLNQPTHSNDRVYGEDGISPSLNTMQGGNRQPFVAQEEMKIRRLTPTECERLQGFPDNWTKYGINDEPISDSQRYKMCGNAVTTNVIQAVFERIFNNPNGDKR